MVTRLKEKVYVGDLGTVVEIEMGDENTNLDGITKLKFCVKKPKMDAGVKEVFWTPVKLENKRYLRYVSDVKTSDFNAAGDYKLQPYGKIGNWEGRGDTYTFKVYNKYE